MGQKTKQNKKKRSRQFSIKRKDCRLYQKQNSDFYYFLLKHVD